MTSKTTNANVLTGLDVLLRDGHPALDGKRFGLLTNHTAVTRGVVSIIDALHNDDRFTIDRLYGPEHGVRGNEQAGDKVVDQVDPATGLDVVSLYGANRAPSAQQLSGIDAMLYDLQDAGARHYTYISALVLLMEACAPANVPVVVLDRPNPITGTRIEGKVLEPDVKSYVGMHPMATRHGLTIGELALMIADEQGLPKPIVIPCEGWERDMWWDETGLPFVYPSPNLPTLNSLIAYTATCLLEATTLSEGRGTTLPFETFGAPWVNPDELAAELNSRDLPGVIFRPAYFTPYISKHPNELCAGAQMHFTDRDAFQPVATGVHIIHALIHLEGSQFEWREGPALGMSYGRLYGSKEIRSMLADGKSPAEIIANWQPGLDNYIARAKAYHLYQ